MIKLIFISSVFSFSIASWAAVPQPSIQLADTSQSKSQILKLLSLPIEQRITKIHKLGPSGYSQLRDISFSKNYTMEQRWKSFYVMTRIGDKKSLPEIERALNDPEWFMRSSGLTALYKVDSKLGLKAAATKFENDESLMVRSAALDILSLKAEKANLKIFEKMFASKVNSYKGRSLWIRKRILEAIAKDGSAQARLMLKKISAKETDKNLKSIAQASLSTISE